MAVEAAPVASYVRRNKRAKGPSAERVDVFPMAVVSEASDWRELHERSRHWTKVQDALAIIMNKDI